MLIREEVCEISEFMGISRVSTVVRGRWGERRRWEKDTKLVTVEMFEGWNMKPTIRPLNRKAFAGATSCAREERQPDKSKSKYVDRKFSNGRLLMPRFTLRCSSPRVREYGLFVS